MKQFSTFYSAIFLICCLLSVAGCSHLTAITPEDEARASLALQAAEDKYGVIKDPDVQNYLRYMMSRLNSGLVKVGKSCSACDLTLLDTPTPLAFSPGPRRIVLSKGLITKLSNEAELAFVVAHEIGHQVLDHHIAVREATLDAGRAGREQLEKDADRFAIGLLAVSGYDPRFAPSALLHAYGKVTPEGGAVGYPELYAREHQLEDEIMEARWTPPGTIDRREFQKLRRQFSAE